MDEKKVVKMVEHFIVMKWTPWFEWEVIASNEDESIAFNAMNSEVEAESQKCIDQWESNMDVSEHSQGCHVVIHWQGNAKNKWAAFKIEKVMMPWMG